MPEKMSIGLQAVTLHWYIIDDNLDQYTIYINNSVWKNDSISSNLLEVKFSNSVGIYNITLTVHDFSNNNASYQMIIIVTQSSQTTPKSNNTNLTKITSYSSYGSPGFSFVETLGFLMCIAIIVNIKKFNNKKKR